MTAVLQLLQDIARHLQVETSVTADQLRDLSKAIDVRQLTERMEDLATADSITSVTVTDANRRRTRSIDGRRARRHGHS